jgi:hypothetical protein
MVVDDNIVVAGAYQTLHGSGPFDIMWHLPSRLEAFLRTDVSVQGFPLIGLCTCMDGGICICQ